MRSLKRNNIHAPPAVCVAMLDNWKVRSSFCNASLCFLTWRRCALQLKGTVQSRMTSHTLPRFSTFNPLSQCRRPLNWGVWMGGAAEVFTECGGDRVGTSGGKQNGNFASEKLGQFAIALPPLTRLPGGPLIILIKLIVNATGMPCYTI